MITSTPFTSIQVTTGLQGGDHLSPGDRASRHLFTRSRVSPGKSQGTSDRRLHVRSPPCHHDGIYRRIYARAYTVQLKDQISLQLGTLGLNAIMRCSATVP